LSKKDLEEPIAAKTKLGWIVYGKQQRAIEPSLKSRTSQKDRNIQHHEVVCRDELQHVKQLKKCCHEKCSPKRETLIVKSEAIQVPKDMKTTSQMKRIDQVQCKPVLDSTKKFGNKTNLNQSPKSLISPEVSSQIFNGCRQVWRNFVRTITLLLSFIAVMSERSFSQNSIEFEATADEVVKQSQIDHLAHIRTWLSLTRVSQMVRSLSIDWRENVAGPDRLEITKIMNSKLWIDLLG
jgi:hypothetical protein